MPNCNQCGARIEFIQPEGCKPIPVEPVARWLRPGNGRGGYTVRKLEFVRGQVLSVYEAPKSPQDAEANGLASVWIPHFAHCRALNSEQRQPVEKPKVQQVQGKLF